MHLSFFNNYSVHMIIIQFTIVPMSIKYEKSGQWFRFLLEKKCFFRLLYTLLTHAKLYYVKKMDECK